MFDIIAYDKKHDTAYVMKSVTNRYYGITLSTKLMENIADGNKINKDGSISLFANKSKSFPEIDRIAIIDAGTNKEIGFVKDHKFIESEENEYANKIPADDDLLAYMPI